MNILKMAKFGLVNAGKFVKRNAPTILTIFGIGSATSAVIFAVKDTPKAMKAIEERKKKENKEKLSKLETVDTAWKYYIPTGVQLLFAVGCMVGANALNLRTQAALLGLYSAKAETLKAVEEKTKELFGTEEEKIVYKDAIKEKIEGMPEMKSYMPSRNDLFPVYEEFSGQIFESNWEHLNRCISEAKNIVHEDLSGLSVNAWLSMLAVSAVKPNAIKIGDDWGWNERTGFDPEIYTEEINHIPCYVIRYYADPVQKYNFADA